VVAAERDYTPIARKRAYVERLRDARLEVIMDSGHATPWDQPRALNQRLLAFLDECSQRKAAKVA
jgi:3-oxoadipate enol-lactonase